MFACSVHSSLLSVNSQIHWPHVWLVAELAIIAIIFIDVLAVCCEIMLESVCPHQKDVSYWKKDFNATYAQYNKDYHVLHDWETALGWISKAILFMFLVKEALLIFAVGIKNYFTKGPHLIDFFITIVAFSLEMGFFLSKQYSNSTQAATLTHLITVLLIWRVVRCLTPHAHNNLSALFLHSLEQIRLLHGMMETTMAVQNHDAALDEKQQLELKYSQAKMMVANLQERVRALEVTARFQDAPGSKHMTWSRQALSQVQLAFEHSSHAVLRVSASVKETDVHSSIAEASAGAQVRAEGSDHHVLFASDYFCTWLTTDPDAKHLGVQYRAHAVNCGMALMEHKVTLIVVG